MIHFNNMTTFFLLYLLSITTTIIHVKAQTLSDNTEPLTSEDPDNNNNTVQPNLAVVIGMLAVIFSLTFILLLYAKFCHRSNSSSVVASHQIHDGLTRAHRSNNNNTSRGLDKTIIESLPFFRFSSLKGWKKGLECSVCLAKFEEVEVLRLLPKCKHAFHIDCIDQWLEKHATCPLCRQLVSGDDLSQLSNSTSLRFLWDTNQTESDHIELYVEREESEHGSSRFSVGGSFRKQSKTDELLIQEKRLDFDEVNDPLDRFDHRIVVNDDNDSDVVLSKYRWSNVSSSDFVFLNSEMIGGVSSSRFELPTTSDSQKDSSGKILCPNEKRSMSEIVAYPRFGYGVTNNNVEEERVRRLWMPIARKTVELFGNREKRPLQFQQLDKTLNV